MRILITGRHGQVARSLAERGASHELIFAARPSFDLGNFAALERTVRDVRPDVVISAAAYTAVDAAEDDAEQAMRLNGDAPGVIARAAAEVGSAIIHLSTDYVFDGTLDRPWREDDRVAPMNVYGASKLAGEAAVSASGATYAIVRTAWVYSPFGANFVKTMLRLAGMTSEVKVVNDQRGCPTSALAIADALLAMIEAWRQNPRHGADAVYHFAGTGETHWADFARAIFAESAQRGGPVARVHDIATSDYPTRAARPANSRLDCARFTRTFRHSAPHWRSSLAEVVERLLAER